MGTPIKTTREKLKRFFGIATPMVVSRAVGIFGTFIGMMFMAELGRDQLAAGALISSLRIVLMLAANATFFCIGPICSRLYGARQHEAIGAVTRDALVLSLIISIPLFFIYHYIGPILVLFGQPSVVVTYTVQFFSVSIYGIIGFQFITVLQQVYVGTGHQKQIMLVSIISMMLMIASSYALILGHCGMPRMGVAGFAWSFVILAYFSLFVFGLQFIFRKSFKRFALFKQTAGSWFSHIKLIWQTGWPIALQFTGDLLGPMLISIFIGWISIDALAAQQILFQYTMLFVVVIFGLQEATSVVIGHAHGEANKTEMMSYAKLSFLVSSTLSLIACIIYVLFPTELGHLFTHTHTAHSRHVISMLPTLFLLMGISTLFTTVTDVSNSALRSLLDTKVPMIAKLTCTWAIEIGCAYIAAFELNLGLLGIWYVCVLANAVNAAWMMIRWLQQSRRVKF